MMKKIALLSLLVGSICCNNIRGIEEGDELILQGEDLLVESPKSFWSVSAVHYFPTLVVMTLSGAMILVASSIMKGIKK